MFRASQRAEVFSFERNNPEAARPREVKIALLVDLQPIECVLALGRTSCLKKVAPRQRSIRIHFVAHDDPLLVVPATRLPGPPKNVRTMRRNIAEFGPDIIN